MRERGEEQRAGKKVLGCGPSKPRDASKHSQHSHHTLTVQFTGAACCSAFFFAELSGKSDAIFFRSRIKQSVGISTTTLLSYPTHHIQNRDPALTSTFDFSAGVE